MGYIFEDPPIEGAIEVIDKFIDNGNAVTLLTGRAQLDRKFTIQYTLEGQRKAMAGEVYDGEGAPMTGEDVMCKAVANPNFMRKIIGGDQGSYRFDRDFMFIRSEALMDAPGGVGTVRSKCSIAEFVTRFWLIRHAFTRARRDFHKSSNIRAFDNSALAIKVVAS